MRKAVSEIQNVLRTHDYSINTIIVEVMKKFKFKSLCTKVGFQKQEGYSASEILTFMIIMPLMMLKSVHALYRSQYQNVTEMKKDAIYRLKNNEKMPWRELLLAVVKKSQSLVNTTKEVARNSAFILDDTIDERTGKKIEQISFVHDHTTKKSSGLGYKNLTLGLFDGKSFTPVDFSIHREKRLPSKERKQQYQKERDPHCAGAKRIKECGNDKISVGIEMLKRANKHGLHAKYVLVDSWFSSKEFIQTVRNMANHSMHVVCGVKKDWRKYTYNGEKLNAKQLLNKLKQEGSEKRCRKRNIRYFEVTVDYEGVGKVKLYFCRFPYQKKWRLFLSTDSTLAFLNMMEIYCVRWTIEVFFKEAKQHLRLGRCQSRDFDAQIAHVTACYILYVFLSYLRRLNAYETLGKLFEVIQEELIEKNLAQRLWELFEELLQVVITTIAESGIVDIKEFRNSMDYLYLKELFEGSFLCNQLKSLDKSS